MQTDADSPLVCAPTPCVGAAVKNGASQCTARSKRSGNRCGAAAVKGRDVCYHHGGATPRGLAHPSTTHGKSSRYMSAGPMADAYAQMHADRSQLHSLADDIAVLEGFRAAHMSQLDGADMQALCDLVADVAGELGAESARLTPSEASQRLIQAVNAARDAMAAMRRTVQASHDKAKLIETDLRRQAQQDKLLTQEQAVSLVYAIVDATKARLTPSDHVWFADQCQRAVARHVFGADPDDAMPAGQR